MAEELFKYIANLPDLNKPKDGVVKIPYVQKQVLNLTGGLFPARLINLPSENAKSHSSQNSKWVQVPIVQQNSKLGQILSWKKQNQSPKPNSIEKPFSEVIQFTREQYEQISDLNWTYEQTTYLFELMQLYNLNFIVVNDRYSFVGKPRTIEQLKEQYYKVNNRLLKIKGVTDHHLLDYKYDSEYDITRKFQMQKYLLRTKETDDQEKKTIQDLRRLDGVIRKQERQQISLKKALKFNQVIDEGTDKQIQETLTTINKEQQGLVYTRQQYLQKSLPLPAKLNTKMVDVLQGLNVPDRIIANQETQQLYDELRKQILLMFSAQRYLRKKQNEKRFLQQKKKKMISRQDEGDKKKLSDPAQKKKTTR